MKADDNGYGAFITLHQIPVEKDSASIRFTARTEELTEHFRQFGLTLNMIREEVLERFYEESTRHS